MLINSFILALTSSIDALGIGITYGIKSTKISYASYIVIFGIAFFISLCSVWLGNSIKTIFPEFILKLIASTILIFMGIFMFIQALKKENNNNHYLDMIKKKREEKIFSFFIKFLGITINIIKNPISSDFDNSKTIDSKEALFLGLALSLDILCIGTCGSILGVNPIIFPILISIFHLLFLFLGNFIGCKIRNFHSFPNNIWSMLSSILLIILGLSRLVF